MGRRKTYLIDAVATGLFGFLYFGMIDTAIPSAVFIAIVLSLIPHDNYNTGKDISMEYDHAA